MELLLYTALDGLSLGLCYALAALGMYIAYSILDFPDLTADGTFPLGGVVATVLMYRLSVHPLLALLGGFAAGALFGMITGFLHVRFRITKLLSGIITMTALLSVTLALTTLLTEDGYSVTNFSYVAKGVDGLFNRGGTVLSRGMILLILAALCLAVKIALDLFFSTKIGYLLRAVGQNECLITSLGRDSGKLKILGLSLTNGLVALSGAVYSSMRIGYDNTCGSGKVVLTLASIIIGLALLGKFRRVRPTTAVIVGAILYSVALNAFTLVDTDGLYLKLLNAAAFAVILASETVFKDAKTKLRLRSERRETK